MGYAFSRAICITVGFLHPAYRHFKHIKAKTEADYLSEESEDISKDFDQHWITMAIFCVAEVLSDYLLFWYWYRLRWSNSIGFHFTTNLRFYSLSGSLYLLQKYWKSILILIFNCPKGIRNHLQNLFISKSRKIWETNWRSNRKVWKKS